MIPNSYRLPTGNVFAGEYPGSLNDDDAHAKLAALLAAGVRTFLDLTSPGDRMRPYDAALAEEAANARVEARRISMPIRDLDVASDVTMTAILDRIDAEVAAGRPVYVHCWGGVGRTGTVVGCWLVRHGATGAGALAEVKRLFGTMSPEKVAAHGAQSPQTPEQCAMVERWGRRRGP